MSVTPYQMTINNVARHIRMNPATWDGTNLDAFTASHVLGIAFCKDKIEVIEDIINAGNNDRAMAKNDPDYIG